MYIWNPKKGGLAHLARALAWQARGDRFESGILHNNKTQMSKNKIFAFLFFGILYCFCIVDTF